MASIQTHMAGRDLEATVRTYAALMETSKSSIDDASSLPLPKGEMKEALLTAMQLTPVGQHREWLKTGYIFLSHFQQLSDDERTAIRSWDGSLNIPDFETRPSRIQKAVFAEIAESGDLYNKTRHRVTEEMSALISELKAAGV